MKETITPEKVQERLFKREINQEKAAELLLSFIERSDDTELRVRSIRMLQELKLFNKTIFKSLENSLVSDENAIVRASIVRYIILNLSEKKISPLRWVIQHDKSPLVLKIFFDYLEKFTKTSLFRSLLDDLLKWNKQFAINIGIVPEESQFFLDLEALFAEEKRNYEIDPLSYRLFENLSDIKNGESWLVIKDKHVEVLNLNYFNWKYIKENQDIYSSLASLNSLELYLNSIRKYHNDNFNFTEIPKSIGDLTYLTKLILKGNNLQRLPKSIKRLTRLKQLDLSYNNFYKIPRVIKTLKSLKKFNLKHNNIQEISDSMHKFVNSLIDFKF